jgi:hypothetical protein
MTTLLIALAGLILAVIGNAMIAPSGRPAPPLFLPVGHQQAV